MMRRKLATYKELPNTGKNLQEEHSPKLVESCNIAPLLKDEKRMKRRFETCRNWFINIGPNNHMVNLSDFLKCD